MTRSFLERLRAGGVRYATLGATTSTSISTTVANLRVLDIFQGQLYTSSGSGTEAQPASTSAMRADIAAAAARV